jgi:hypothetical protein
MRPTWLFTVASETNSRTVLVRRRGRHSHRPRLGAHARCAAHVSAVADLSRFLPSNAGNALWGVAFSPVAMAPWNGFALFCGVAAALLVTAASTAIDVVSSYPATARVPRPPPPGRYFSSRCCRSPDDSVILVYLFVDE